MNYPLHTFILGIIGIVVFVVIIGIVILFWHRKKICHHCLQQETRDRDADGDALCEDCRNAELLRRASKDSPTLICPEHGTIMKPRILIEFDGDIIVHTCPNQGCDHVVIPRKDLSKVSMQELEFYPA